MNILAVPKQFSARLRGVDGWLDEMLSRLANPTQRDRTALVFILAQVVLWTIYGVVSKGSEDIHFDMGEALVWFRERWLNTPKHPPLSAWIPGAWFSVFPRQDWAYYLLAILGSGLGLWCAWQLSKRYLRNDKLAVALILPTFVPFYNFHAFKFNANSLMIPVWGLATWAFVRSWQSRSPGAAALAGLAGAAVMLCKYWGIFLLVGFATAAILDPRRSQYFRSWAPWISIAVGVCVLLPHLASVATNGFESLNYALQSHASTWYASFLHAPKYLAAVIAYLIGPIVAIAIASRGNWSVLSDTIFPRDPDRRLCLVIFLVPIFLPLLVAPLFSSDVNALWMMGGLSLLPTILLSSPLLTLSRRASRTILAAAIVFPMVLVAASPIIVLCLHLKRHQLPAAHYRLLANEIESRWKALSDQRLRLIGGDDKLVNGTAFYMETIPSTFDINTPSNTPWMTEDRIRREGIVIICTVEEQPCVSKTKALFDLNAAATVEVISLSRRYLGIEGSSQRYFLVIFLPVPQMLSEGGQLSASSPE